MDYKGLNKLSKFIKTHKDPNQPRGLQNSLQRLLCNVRGPNKKTT